MKENHMDLCHSKKLRLKANRQFRVGGKFAKKPSNADIRHRASQIWQTRMKNGIQGDHVSDWLQAERELASK